MNPSWTLIRTSSQSELGVSLQEAKDHLRVSGNALDDEITLLIEASTEKFERDINRGLLNATWQQSMQCFPSDMDSIQLHMGGTTAVTSITYTDEDGNTQTLPASDYSFSAGRNQVFCETTDGWPAVDMSTKSDKVFINFTCGATDSGCLPRLYKQAILLEVGRAYFDPAQENGVNTNDGRSYESIVRRLIRSTYP